MTKRYEPELPTPELHSPETPDLEAPTKEQIAAHVEAKSQDAGQLDHAFVARAGKERCFYPVFHRDRGATPCGGLIEDHPIISAGAAEVADPGLIAGLTRSTTPELNAKEPFPLGRHFDTISDCFPHGNKFAEFNLAGDCTATIYAPGPGYRTVAVELVTGSAPFTEGAPDTRRRTVLQLPKAKARALASAIMGAAAEL